MSSGRHDQAMEEARQLIQVLYRFVFPFLFPLMFKLRMWKVVFTLSLFNGVVWLSFLVRQLEQLRQLLIICSISHGCQNVLVLIQRFMICRIVFSADVYGFKFNQLKNCAGFSAKIQKLCKIIIVDTSKNKHVKFDEIEPCFDSGFNAFKNILDSATS